MAPIDVVILNAGTQVADRRETSAQGYELNFTVNVIAPASAAQRARAAARTEGARGADGPVHAPRQPSFVQPRARSQWRDPRHRARADQQVPCSSRRRSRPRHRLRDQRTRVGDALPRLGREALGDGTTAEPAPRAELWNWLESAVSDVVTGSVDTAGTHPK